MTTPFISIPSIKEFKGRIPSGYDLVIYETECSPVDGYVLYGFNEIGMFAKDFVSPAYGFLSSAFDHTNELGVMSV